MLTGYIRQFLPERGFGFIRATDETDFFFHVTDWESGNIAEIVRHARVNFDVATYRIRATNEERVKAVHIALSAPQAAPKPQPQIPYEPTPEPVASPKQPRIAGQAKTILSTDDAPRPAYAPASPGHATTAAAALAEADSQLKFGLTAPKNDGGAQ